MGLKGKSIIITGASRGIGRSLALRFAQDGARICLAAKSFKRHPKLPGTVLTVAKEVTEAGGEALPLKVDVRKDEDIQMMVKETVKAFGGIDILVNNAGAIFLTSVQDTPMKRFDLMHQVNVRATFQAAQAVFPFLKDSESAHVLNISPPLSWDTKWYQDYLAYSLSKFGMSMCTIGLAAEFSQYRISVNSLWPQRLIATAATRWLMGEERTQQMRKPTIMADAAYAILNATESGFTGKMLLDEDYLRSLGEKDFEKYNITPGVQAPTDLYVD